MFNPISTYRIQFHKEFTFKRFERIIPYLTNLGVKTIYASPVFQSTPGSTHGYDGVNPLVINPEIGTLEQLYAISKVLKAKGISWIQDIVPNHMAFHTDNPWLMDVLAHGPSSRYRNYFDQQLSDADFFSGPIMVPFLGNSLDQAIEAGEISIALNQRKLTIAAAGQFWPLNAKSQKRLLNTQKLPATLPIGKVLTGKLATVNADKILLKTIAEEQYYRLCNWEETDHQINFRRFFTVNGLICLNIQRQDVFDNFHRLINTLLKDDIIQGIRIDHIDGLYDPTQYLERLRAMAGEDAYILIEKILEPGEKLKKWPVQGTTGYDFLATVNNLFTTRKSEDIFNRFYQSIIPENIPVKKQIENKKADILHQHMAGELDNLVKFFVGSHPADVDVSKIKEVIGKLLIKYPVYRGYGNKFPLPTREEETLKSILKEIGSSQPDLKPAVKLIRKALLKNHEPENEGHVGDITHFYQRCMQFTGPLMAKGVEDTLMYTYNRFIDHNEVGDAPDAFGISINGFHKKMKARQKHWPLSLNATATHDTKRGEDVRARLNVLSNIPEEWVAIVREWQAINFDLKARGAPDANDELFIYQTLIGTYPMPGESDNDFSERLITYLQKTLREGKQHSDWAKPNEEYELAVTQFVQKLLEKSGAFWQNFAAFHQKISDFGVVNSLTQTALKFNCPGVPDIYQGCEHWDFSMVDPDNRRPVDYRLRRTMAKNKTALAHLWDNRFDGTIKVKLVQTLLKARANDPLLWTHGEYIPLTVTGKYQEHIIAFARHYRDKWVVTIAPLNIATICNRQQTEINRIDWGDTAVSTPTNSPSEFANLLSGQQSEYKNQIPVNEIFKELPIAVLRTARPATRGSGILMHITSLPSDFGIGDLGPEARDFALLLHSARQTYWQVLPINPTIAEAGHSPYSAYSSRAGNVLLISPELLAGQGLISRAELKFHSQPPANRVDFEQAAQAKNSLINIAWFNFSKTNQNDLHTGFREFCQQEADWLDDYAMFMVLKELHQGLPWYQWPISYQKRTNKALRLFADKNDEAIMRAKWLQYIFNQQWQQLKTYCNNLDIKLFGDLPFYMSYDSVDVWVNPEYFSLDAKFKPETVAGVPPDYFNKDGQLWGMPVYNWDALKAKQYDWWVKRIKKNIEWFDLLRLDHFRAFSAYWAVPATESMAINGQWLPGPGMDVFRALKRALGKVPFVAEDLGEIDEQVRQLRGQLGFPGMKVLQFAFGEELPYSEHAPHHHAENFLIYTGTHDNNTSPGWFNQDIAGKFKKQIQHYTGLKPTSKNIGKLMIRMALQSNCKIAIIPIQDLLNLDESARMNTPASTSGNWTWRLTPGLLKKSPFKFLKSLTIDTNR